MKKFINKNNNNQSSNFVLLYTCLSLLLLCFFIFLIANSITDSRRKKVAIGSLTGAFGFFRNGISIIGDNKKKDLGFSLIPITKDRKLMTELMEIVSLYKQSKIILLDVNEKGITVKFKKNSIFRNNSVKLNKKLTPVILRIANRLSNLNKIKVNIETYYNDPYISAYRAFNLAKFFSDKTNFTINEIETYGKLGNNLYDAKIFFSGYGKESNSINREIKSGDFIFKVK